MARMSMRHRSTGGGGTQPVTMENDAPEADSCHGGEYRQPSDKEDWFA
jgi:hypothetical protein